MAAAPILITGATGYLGGRLATHLAALGQPPRLLSRRPADALPAWADPMESVAAGLDDLDALRRACEGARAVVHLAAMNAGACAADPAAAVRVNVEGTQNLISAARAAGVADVLHVSTAHVYGAPLAGAIDETTPPRPRHPYAWTHRAAEDIVLGTEGLAGRVVRLSNAVGAPADAAADCWMLAANDLCRQAVERGALHLAGDGQALRDWVAMGDVCRAVVHLLDIAPAPGPVNIGGQVLNVGALAELVAARAEALLGIRPPIHTGAPPGPPPQPLEYRCPRLGASGFVHRHTLAEEIDATLLVCREAFAP